MPTSSTAQPRALIWSADEPVRLLRKHFPAHTLDGSPLEAVAMALLSSPVWQHVPEARLVTRASPKPMMAILGTWPDHLHNWLSMATTQPLTALRQLRYISASDTPKLVHDLAEALIDTLGADIETASFIGIPRGGLSVLGMLASAIGISSEQIGHENGSPLVIVDDCAISGARFGQTLRAVNASDVVFAPLLSIPALRQLITDREPSVRAVVSAADLADRTDETVEHPDEWRKKWRQRSSELAYWHGRPDHVCFPWNEPDVAVWDDSARTVRQGFKVVPPSHCLKNAAAYRALGREPYVMPSSIGGLRFADSVFMADLDDWIHLVVGESQDSMVLDGTAAAMVRALTNSDSVASAINRMAALYGAPRERVHADMVVFIDSLKQRGVFVD